MSAGIYLVKCIVNNKIYIGSTINFNYREKKHFRDLESGVSNKKMQEDYNLYGKENFIFEILEETNYDDSFITDRENYWINKLNALNPKKGYNKTYAVRRSNSRQRENISKALKERKMNGEFHPGSKLTLSECKEIKKLFIEKGYSAKKISEIYNVSHSLIKEIRKGHHWSSKELGCFDDWEKEIVKKIKLELDELISTNYYTNQEIYEFLSEKYNRTISYISKIKYNKNKYLSEELI